MNNKLFLALLSVPLAGLLLWTINLEFESKSFPEVTVRMQGFDPRSLLSGHYISYRIDWEKTDCRQFADNTCPREDFMNDGLDSWMDAYGSHRFYIPQEKANDLDTMFRQSNRTGDIFEVVYSYKKGFRPIAKRLLINGEDWHIALQKSKDKQKNQAVSDASKTPETPALPVQENNASVEPKASEVQYMENLPGTEEIKEDKADNVKPNIQAKPDLPENR